MTTAPTPTVTIPDVEICRVGNWASALSGRVPITVADLDAMAAAAADPEIDHAPVKIGHVDPRFDGEPAFGWLTNIRVAGDRIVADLADVPRQMAHLVQTAFKRRSAEIAWNVKTPSGKTYKAALAGLALLGVTPPAVKGLADVVARYSGPTNSAEGRGTVTIVDGDDGELADLEAAVLNAQAALDARRALLSAHSGDLPAGTPDTFPDGSPSYPEGRMTDDQVRAALGLPAEVPVTDQIRALAARASDGGAPAGDPAQPAQPQPQPQPAQPEPAPQPAPAEPAPAPAQPAPAPAEPAPTTTVDAAALAALQAQAAEGARAMSILNEQERERELAAALSGGRIAPASVAQWRSAWDRDKDGTKALLSTLPQVFSTVTNFSASAGTAGQPVDNDGISDTAWADFEKSLGL